MRRFIYAWIIGHCLFFSQAQAQERNTGRWAITFTPAFIPLPSGGQFGIQPGIEYNFNNRWSLLTEITFQTGKKQIADSAALDKKYYRIKEELRFHLPGKNKKLSKYIALQATYSARSFRNEKEGFYYDNLAYDSVYYFDKAKITSPITTLSLQFGYILAEGKHFAADMFVGTGLRLVHTQYTDVQNLRQDRRLRPGDWFTATASYQQNGRLSELHLNAGIRFMYRFGKMP